MRARRRISTVPIGLLLGWSIAQSAAPTAESVILAAAKVYLAPDVAPLEDAYIVLRDGKIAGVGRSTQSNASQRAMTSECSGGIVMAGFQNSHVSEDALKLRAILEERDEVPDDDNAYIYLLGFSASEEMDPQVAGAQRLAWLKERGYLAADRADPFPEVILRGDRPQEIEQLANECRYPNALAHANAEIPKRAYTRLYNILGDILFDASATQFGSYAVRVGDLEGMRRAALVTVQLRSRSVPLERMQEEIEKADLKNHYTGAPLEWSEEERVIAFMGSEEGERGRHSYLY